jgi:hypothetical protein
MCLNPSGHTMLAARRVPSEDGAETVRPEQTVTEMAGEALNRQTKALVSQTEQPFEAALKVVADTVAGRQLKELADSAYREHRAEEWQDTLPWKRAEERHYSWLESYVGWLEGKEARSEYYALLEEELASLRG